MNSDKIIEDLQVRLDMHAKSTLGHIGQEPYKSDLFSLFEAAYHGGLFDIDARKRLTGDTIRDTLTERWLDAMPVQQRDKASELLENFLRRWDEWRYAWEKAGVKSE